jgi:FlaA1/EpsC-like NDP-sugar epimerase
MASDVLIIGLSYLLAYLLRFGPGVPGTHFQAFLKSLPLIVAVNVAAFWKFRIYSGIWRYFSIQGMISIILAVTTSTVLVFGLSGLVSRPAGYPKSVFLINWFVLIVLLGGYRFTIRVFRNLRRPLLSILRDQGCPGKRVMIVGAGDAGEMILREMRQNPRMAYIPVCLIDDNPEKLQKRIHGIPVLGNQTDIPQVVMEKAVDEAIIAIPSASGEQISRIVDQCRRAKVKFRTVPAVAELINGCIVGIRQIRDVRVEDILGREPIKLDLREAQKAFLGKTIVITGAGGSIGSELARQSIRFKPARILLYEREESNLFRIHQEMMEIALDSEVIPIVGDILDEARLDEVIGQYRPSVIFHAAAYKHVPMMEGNPFEAIQNNILGTLTVARASVDRGVDKFVLISTDKAINPTSVMGASKRAAEKAILSLGKKATAFVVVRFGNVLASRGSVVSIFEKQIARGGPVTVTHPDVTRYFMTIPEAVQLVLLASSIGRGGEIFLLDMGKPVRIMDLAESMIRLSGLEPGQDIPIKFIGLRPGEKLHEELSTDSETVVPTGFDRILSVKYDRRLYNGDVLAKIRCLQALTESRNERAIRLTLQEIVMDPMSPRLQTSSKARGKTQISGQKSSPKSQDRTCIGTSTPSVPEGITR